MKMVFNEKGRNNMNKRSDFIRKEKMAVNIPELTESEREKIFMRSKEKLDMLKEKENTILTGEESSENKTDDKKDKEYDSNEKIKVSYLKPVISVAACFVLAAGVSAIMFFTDNKKQNIDIKNSSMVYTESVTDKHSDSVRTTETTTIKTTKKKPDTTTVTYDMEKSATENTMKNTTQNVIHQNQDVATTKPSGTTTEQTKDDSSKTDDLTKEKEYKKIAEKLGESLNDIYSMTMGGGVDYDETKVQYYYKCNYKDFLSSEYPDGKYPYNYVSDTRFKSLSDISSYIDSVFTKNGTYTDCGTARKYFKETILNKDFPKFIEHNGNLYGLLTLIRRSGGGGFMGEIEKIEDIKDNSFTAYMDKGSSDKVIMEIVKENGVWKLNKVDEKFYNDN